MLITVGLEVLPSVLVLLVPEKNSKHELTLAFLLILCLVVMEIQSFRVMVNLEFLLVLSDVFRSALVGDKSGNSAPLTSQQPSKAIATKDKPEPAATVNTTDKEPPQITVQIFIKDPEIVLLADARDKDTNALFLRVSKLYTTASFKGIRLQLN